jgi:ribonuclease HI
MKLKVGLGVKQEKKQIVQAQKKLKTFSDGGSRGNPGPAAAAYIILSEGGEILKSASFFLGRRTNNQAEYEALIKALECAAEMRAEEVLCLLDSELVCKHVTGEYKVRKPDLFTLWKKVQYLKNHFIKVSFENVPRTNEFIFQADKLVNDELDKWK